MNKIKLKVKWGISVRWITYIVLIVMAVVEYYAITSWLYSKEDWIKLILICGIPLVILYCAIESPVLMELNETRILLHKLKGRLIIAYEQIEYVDYYKPDNSKYVFSVAAVFSDLSENFQMQSLGLTKRMLAIIHKPF